jgi:hypothetical protein
VLRGHGNDGADGMEGVRGGAHDTVIGTYLHGPLLPKNAWFADWLTATAIGAHPTRSSRSTTRSKTPRTPRRGAPPACSRAEARRAASLALRPAVGADAHQRPEGAWSACRLIAAFRCSSDGFS